MKNNFFKIFALSFALILAVGISLNAQNYRSKPQAVKNLADEAKYLSSTLAELSETDIPMYKVNKEKLRFIKSMLKGLKSERTVEESADKLLPKEEMNVFQPSVRFIDTNFANTSRNKYIRSEILFLITY